jgi:hypothetical protein
MKTLTLTEQDARKIYPHAPNELKVILENSFTKSFFQEKITDRIKTFEDACRETGESPHDVKFSDGTADEIAYKKLKVIIKALNEGWEPDWNKSLQPKWRPWFYLNSPGFRFHDASCDSPGSAVGSRLCLKSEELCVYAAKQFPNLYKDLFTA